MATHQLRIISLLIGLTLLQPKVWADVSAIQSHIDNARLIFERISKIEASADPQAAEIVRDYYQRHLLQTYVIEAFRRGRSFYVSSIEHYNRVGMNAINRFAELQFVNNTDGLAKYQKCIDEKVTHVQSDYRSLRSQLMQIENGLLRGRESLSQYDQVANLHDKLIGVEYEGIARSCCRASGGSSCSGTHSDIFSSLDPSQVRFPDAPASIPNPLRGMTPRQLAILLKHADYESAMQSQVGTHGDLGARARREQAFYEDAAEKCQEGRDLQKSKHPLNNPGTISLAMQALKCSLLPYLTLHHGSDLSFDLTMGLASSDIQWGEYNANCDPGIVANWASQRVRDPFVLEEYWNIKDPPYLNAMNVIQPLYVPPMVYGVASSLANNNSNSAAALGLGGAGQSAESNSELSQLGRSRAENRVVSRNVQRSMDMSSSKRQVQDVRRLSNDIRRGSNPLRGVATLRDGVNRTRMALRGVMGGGDAARNVEQSKNLLRQVASTGQARALSLTSSRAAANASRSFANSYRSVGGKASANTSSSSSSGRRGGAPQKKDVDQVVEAEKAKVRDLVLQHIKNMEYTASQSQKLHQEIQQLYAQYQADKAKALSRMMEMPPKKQAAEARRVVGLQADLARRVGELKMQYNVLVSAMNQEYYSIQSLSQFVPGALPLPNMGAMPPGAISPIGSFPPNYPKIGTPGSTTPNNVPPASAPGAWLLENLFKPRLAWAAQTKLNLKDNATWLSAWQKFSQDYERYSKELEKQAEADMQNVFAQYQKLHQEGQLGGLAAGRSLLEAEIFLGTVGEEVSDLLLEFAEKPADNGQIISDLRTLRNDLNEALKNLDEASLRAIQIAPDSPDHDPAVWWGMAVGSSLF